MPSIFTSLKLCCLVVKQYGFLFVASFHNQNTVANVETAHIDNISIYHTVSSITLPLYHTVLSFNGLEKDDLKTL